MPAETASFPPYPTEPGGRDEVVEVRVDGTADGGRVFVLTSTAAQRDHGPRRRRIVEPADALRAVTGSPLFDALAAQAVDDARLDMVSSIRDGAYRHGEPIPCVCFKTGEKWPYVWTRDVSYAACLGLAMLDPTRMATTLAFKVSPFRDGLPLPEGLPEGSLQIVQDTGSGGSWPVSTDRVAWAFGAEAVLAVLHGKERDAFADLAVRALAGSIAADRLAAFDPADGLYRGEQSFLDWRDQTYAPYVIDDLTAIAASKALSTNVCHLKALTLAATLAAERGETAAASRYAGWADDLRAAIDRGFFVPGRRLLASITTPDSPAQPVEKFDMLGIALAVLAGVVPADRARSMLAAYPHAPFGVPVYYPAQPDVVCYHNRALWPFVTAFELLAAAEVGAVAVADHAYASLMRGAALYLNNVENQEWLTGRTAFDDGPCISSERQLWSVGGYLGLVTAVVFGYRPAADGFSVAPFLTAAMRDGLGAEARLDGIVHHGKRLAVRLALPARQAGPGHWPVAEVRLNGIAIDGPIVDALLASDNLIDVSFADFVPADDALTLMPVIAATSHDDPAVFSPREPVITDLVIDDGRVRLNFEGQLPRSGRRDALRFDVLRDGLPAATGIDATVWFDPEPLSPGIRRAYRVIARFASSGNASHPSREAAIEAVITHGIDGPNVRRDGDRIVVDGIVIREAGDYRLHLGYANHSFHIQTGVTNAVKRLTLVAADGTMAASGVVEMPHMTPVTALRRSTALACRLGAGSYRLEIADFFNMSFLEANATYISPGGMSGPNNDADIRLVDLVRTG